MPGNPAANAMLASSQVVNAYAAATSRRRRARWDFEEESPLRDLRGFDLTRDLADPSLLTDEEVGLANVILTNGARLYVDHAHPEYSTPEVTNPRDAVLWDKAGELIARRAGELASAIPGAQRLLLTKNNTDNKGASYGSHENYLMSRTTPFNDIVRHLVPFFVSRQVVCGAGRVGIGQDGSEHGFQIAQRADYIEVEVGLETTLKRPIVNTRDEPHADPERYRRLHVIIGDANLSEISSLLKIGTTALVLAMIEADFLGGDLAVDKPVPSLHEVSHDPSLRTLLRLTDGRGSPPSSSRWSTPSRRGSSSRTATARDADPLALDVLDRWESVLTRLEPTRCHWPTSSTGSPSCPCSRATARATGWTGRTPDSSSSTCSTPTCAWTRASTSGWSRPAGCSGCCMTTRSSTQSTTRPRTPARTSAAGA